MDMKLTTGILITAITMAAGAAGFPKAAAQDTDAIDNARSVAKSLQQKQANDSNAALDAAGVPKEAPKQAPQQASQPASQQPSSKPAPGAPAPAVRPAVIPSSKPASAPAAAAAAPAAQSTPSSSQNKLQKVEVVQGADGVQIEIVSNHAVTPKVSKLSSPARVLVELPETVSAAPQNKVSVGSAGVKDVRIGTDGKTPPTTSVVVDLEKACAYELTPGPEGKLILTLHTDGASPSAAPGATAKNASAPAKSSAPTAKSQAPAPVVPKTPATSTSKTAATESASAKPATGSKSATSGTQAAKSAASASTAKPATTKIAAAPAPPAKTQAPAAVPAAPAAAETASNVEVPKPADQKKDDKKWAMNGKRDPFFSPVVQQNGSGCSTGKKCLEIGNINLRGVVKSDNGFIAVVTNNLNKAYFLRENDPVFNGYVVKITGDSVVFQETVQDKLGKPFTREIVKRIFTPAV
jgi:Tfp pilus assembly protein PilP